MPYAWYNTEVQQTAVAVYVDYVLNPHIEKIWFYARNGYSGSAYTGTVYVALYEYVDHSSSYAGDCYAQTSDSVNIPYDTGGDWYYIDVDGLDWEDYLSDGYDTNYYVGVYGTNTIASFEIQYYFLDGESWRDQTVPIDYPPFSSPFTTEDNPQNYRPAIYIEYSYSSVIPNPPSNFDVSPVYGSDECLDISWDKGTFADYTRVQYQTGSYPTTISSGTNAYNNTGTSFQICSLSSGTNYYFSAWSYNITFHTWSATYSTDYNAPYTRPNPPDTVIGGVDCDLEKNILTWEVDSGYYYVRIQYNTVSTFPTTISSGTNLCNITDNVKHHSIDTDYNYNYSMWCFDPIKGLFSSSYTIKSINSTICICEGGSCECNSTNLTIYNNTIYTTGKYETSYNILTGWDIWFNFTGILPTFNHYENIINATGSHEYNTQNGSYTINSWANYTGYSPNISLNFSCEGNYTINTYYCTEDFDNITFTEFPESQDQYIYDKNWDTYAEVNGNDKIVFINYTIPNTVINATWITYNSYYDISREYFYKNFSIDNSYFSTNQIWIKLYFEWGDSSHTTYYIYDFYASEWVELFNGNIDRFYEEKLCFNVSEYLIIINVNCSGSQEKLIYLFENIINATGSHEYNENETGYQVWANYTGNTSICEIEENDFYSALITSLCIGGYGLIMIKRRKKQYG